jgi:transposase-like protein
MDCPECKSNHHVKDGKVGGLQRYKCKTCIYRYGVSGKSNVKSVEVKRLALSMYLEGLGFKSIGRVLKISYGTVYAWVKAWGSKSHSASQRRSDTDCRTGRNAYLRCSKKLLLDMDCC